MTKPFEQWMKEVDMAVRRMLLDMTVEDLPDYAYAQAYEEGRLPRVVARQAIRAAGGF